MSTTIIVELVILLYYNDQYTEKRVAELSTSMIIVLTLFLFNNIINIIIA